MVIICKNSIENVVTTQMIFDIREFENQHIDQEKK